jgi:hypothetical protein
MPPIAGTKANLHNHVTLPRLILWQYEHMSHLKNAVIDGTLIAIAAPIIGKSHEIATATKAAHGTFFKVDAQIVKNAFKQNAKGTVMCGVCAGVAFATISWASNILSDRKQKSQAAER